VELRHHTGALQPLELLRLLVTFAVHAWIPLMLMDCSACLMKLIGVMGTKQNWLEMCRQFLCRNGFCILLETNLRSWTSRLESRNLTKVYK